MVTFEPMDLETQVKAAIEKIEFLYGNIEDIQFDEFSAEDLNDKYDVVINADSKVCLYMGQGDYPITTVGFLLNICEKLSESRLNDSQSYAKNQNEIDFLLTVDDYNTMMILEGLERSNNPVVCKLKTGIYFWTNKVVVDKETYEIALFKGICLYHILVEQSGNHDKYLPSYCENDYFVRIVSQDILDMKVADNLAVSFAFELQSTHGFVLSFSSGRPDPEYIYYDENELTRQPYEIFPLLYGRGINEILSLYNKSKMVLEPDYKILCLTKVLEYISPTIAQEKLYECVRLKLSSPTVLCPTSDYINELGMLYTEGDFGVWIYKDNQLHESQYRYKEQLHNCLENKSVFKVTDGRYSSADNTISFKINSQDVRLGFKDADINGLKQFEKFNTPEYRTECGSFRFEFYIFDFNVDSENPSKYFLDGDDKKIIREHRIYLYRDGLRVMPYGDPEDDWLRIDIARGTIRADEFLSNDQVVGCVYISQAENPKLIDKTNREGLIEDGRALDDFTARVQNGDTACHQSG